MKLICPNCKARYEKGKFCIECGTPLVEIVKKIVRFCPTCQEEQSKGNFCSECGTRLEEREIEVCVAPNTCQVAKDTPTINVATATSNLHELKGRASTVNKLPMDEIRHAAEASYPKESLKAIAVAVLKIAEVIQERLPDADVSYMVHPSVFDATCSPDDLPIHFLFKKNGIPKVAVVAVTQYGYRATHVVGTANCCAKNGITYVKVFANGSFADWIQGWSEFTPYGPEHHGPVTPETIEFCKNWLVENITRDL